jgi:hypothetical protein
MKIVYKPCGRCTVIVRFSALAVSRVAARGMPGTPAGVGMIAPGQATDRLQVRIAGRMSRSPRGHSAGSHRDKWTDSRRGAAGLALQLPDCGDQLADHGLAIAVEHAGVVTEEQCVFDTGEALTLAALDHNDIV